MINKFIKPVIAVLLIFSLYACNDKKNENNSQASVPPVNNEPIIKNVETVIGQTSNQTITLKNPLTSDAEVVLNITLNDSTTTFEQNQGYISKNITNVDYSKCAAKGTDGIIRGTLAAGQECDITYTFSPTTFENSEINLTVDYSTDFALICPTPDAKPSIDQITNSSKQEQYIINNYAVNSNGVKAYDIKKVTFDFNYSIDALIKEAFTPKSFSIALSKDDKYSAGSLLNGLTFEADNKNCTFSNNTITALADGDCTITVNYTNSGQQLTSATISGYLRPVEQNTEKPVYRYDLEVNAEQEYENVDINGQNFSIMYVLGMPLEYYQQLYQTYVAVINSESTYSITGNNAGAFKLSPTKYNGCTVTADKITVPEGQTDCYVTAEFTGFIPGTYSATADINGTQYNITGMIDYISNIYCSQMTSVKK